MVMCDSFTIRCTFLVVSHCLCLLSTVAWLGHFFGSFMYSLVSMYDVSALCTMRLFLCCFGCLVVVTCLLWSITVLGDDHLSDMSVEGGGSWTKINGYRINGYRCFFANVGKKSRYSLIWYPFFLVRDRGIR